MIKSSHFRAVAVSMLPVLAAYPAAAAEMPTAAEAAAALKRAVAFFRQEVGVEGGYLWRYSADLSAREGEGAAGAMTAWVQPPGTPSVGQAYLDAYRPTGDGEYLDAARETGLALVRGQLQSGGWDYRIEFAPAERRKYAYRVEAPNPGGRNVTTLDDNTTQSAIGFLMQLDEALEFRDEVVHGAAAYALDSLLQAQYPNGAWPQRYSAFPEASQHPVKPAAYPETWPREHPQADYRGHYTFNDGAIGDVIETLLDAGEIYDEPKYRAAAERGGEFILLAQMPDPQPAWAQQYDADMHPAWARKFEPPAISGGESQDVLRTLLVLYRRTGDRRYLDPIPRALAYLRSSLLPDGRLARFYELRTNRPLYFTRDYKLTYKSNDLPTHYSFIGSSRLDQIEAEYKRLHATDPHELGNSHRNEQPDIRLTPGLAEQARAIVDALDDRGAWVEDGSLRTSEGATRIIDSRTFVNHVRTLARFIAAVNR